MIKDESKISGVDKSSIKESQSKWTISFDRKKPEEWFKEQEEKETGNKAGNVHIHVKFFQIKKKEEDHDHGHVCSTEEDIVIQFSYQKEKKKM